MAGRLYIEVKRQILNLTQTVCFVGFVLPIHGAERCALIVFYSSEICIREEVDSWARAFFC